MTFLRLSLNPPKKCSWPSYIQMSSVHKLTYVSALSTLSQLLAQVSSDVRPPLCSGLAVYCVFRERPVCFFSPLWRKINFIFISWRRKCKTSLDTVCFFQDRYSLTPSVFGTLSNMPSIGRFSFKYYCDYFTSIVDVILAPTRMAGFQKLTIQKINELTCVTL